jgi:hypothetical protein
MKQTKVYIWHLANFLVSHRMYMSAEELAQHLNRNDFLTTYGSKYQGGRGTYTLIRETWSWLNDELELPDEAAKVAEAFVNQDGKQAWLKD